MKLDRTCRFVVKNLMAARGNENSGTGKRIANEDKRNDVTEVLQEQQPGTERYGERM